MDNIYESTTNQHENQIDTSNQNSPIKEIVVDDNNDEESSKESNEEGKNDQGFQKESESEDGSEDDSKSDSVGGLSGMTSLESDYSQKKVGFDESVNNNEKTPEEVMEIRKRQLKKTMMKNSVYPQQAIKWMEQNPDLHHEYLVKSNHNSIDTMKLIIKAIVRERKKRLGPEEDFEKMLNNNSREKDLSAASDNNMKPLSKTLEEKARVGGEK